MIFRQPVLPERRAAMNSFPEIDMIATGRNIIRLRKMNGMSVRRLQEKMGFMTPQAIYKWQQGVSLPSVDNLVVLAMVFHVHMDDIIVIAQSGSAVFTA